MVSGLVGTIAVGLFVMVAGLGSYANATGHPIPTRIGLIKFGGVPPVGSLYKLVSKAPNPPFFTLPGSSPAATGGTLTVAMTGGEITCDLQAGAWDGNRGWKELGNPPGSKGYKYMNKGAPGNDPCKIVIVKEKMIKVLAKATGTLPVPVGNPPGNPDISTVLSLGTNDYSALWVASHYKEKADKLIKAKDQPAVCNDGFPPGDGTLSLTEVAEFTSGVEGVAVCPNGDVFTSQFHTQVIWRLPYGGGAPEEYVTLGDNLLPVGLTCDDQGRLFAARWPNGGGAGSCVRIDYQGHGGIDMPSSVGGADLVNPNGIAFVPGIGVYMTDSARGIIVRYDEDTPDNYSITLAADDAHLVGELGLAGANGLAYHAASRKLYVAVSVPGLLYRYDVEPDGSLTSPELLWDPTGLVITDGVAVDETGEAYVSQYFGHEVLRVSDSQVMVSKAMDAGFETPASYAFRGGTLFITRYNLDPGIVGKLFAFDLGICGGSP